MDHRVSKDMISSGMTPSGKKTQADLGKTQYGSAPSPSRLMDAYQSMYDKKDEVINEHHQKDENGNTIPHDDVKEGKLNPGLQAFLDKKKGKKKVKEENINELKTRTMLNYIDKASDSASKQLDKAEKTTSRKKEVKARLKMDQRERGIEMAKDKIMKRVKSEEVDKFDIVFNHFIEEGFGEKDIIQAMSSLTEEQLKEAGPLAALAPLLGKVGAIAKGAGGAGKVAAGAAKVTKSGGAIVQGGAKKTMLGKIGKFANDNPLVTNMALQQGMQPKEKVNKTGVTSNQPTAMAASADLFDIVKGQLLDEGLSEEEIKDIMLELTPEEILNEISGKLAMQASKAADMKRSELAKAGDKSGAADKAAQASRLYKKGAERNLAKQDLSKPLNPQRTDYPMGKGANYQQKPGM